MLRKVLRFNYMHENILFFWKLPCPEEEDYRRGFCCYKEDWRVVGGGNSGWDDQRKWPKWWLRGGEEKLGREMVFFSTLASNFFFLKPWNSHIFLGGGKGIFYL